MTRMQDEAGTPERERHRRRAARGEVAPVGLAHHRVPRPRHGGDQGHAARSRCRSRPRSSRSTTDDRPRRSGRPRRTAGPGGGGPARGRRAPPAVGRVLLGPHRARLRRLPRARPRAGRARAGLLRDAVGLVRARLGLHARHVAVRLAAPRCRRRTRRPTAARTATSRPSTASGDRTSNSRGSKQAWAQGYGTRLRPHDRGGDRPRRARRDRRRRSRRATSPTPGRPSSTSSARRSRSTAARHPPAACRGARTSPASA